MKSIRFAPLLLLALLVMALIASPAWAGCTNGATNWPDCNNNVPPPTSAPADGQVQGQNQGQDQKQDQTQTANGGDSSSVAAGGDATSLSNATGGAGGNATGGDAKATGGSVGDTSSSSGGNTLKGGNSSSSVGDVGSSSNTRIGNVGSTSGASSGSESNSGGNKTRSSADNSGGNSSVSVDGSDHSQYTDNSRFTVIPPVVPPTPPAMIGVGQISTSRSACGPQQVVVRQPYSEYYFGFFKTKTLDGGYTDTLEPASLAGAPNPFTIITYADGTKVWLGSQVIVSTAVLGNAAGRNLALGGGSGSGNWGQVGGGASSTMQRLVTAITVMQCVYAYGPAQQPPVELPQLHQRIRQ